MPRREVLLTPAAVREMNALSPDVALRIGRKLGELESNPSPRGDTVKRLVGFHSPLYRLRIGDFRAVFRVTEDSVILIRIVHRSELDRCLRDLS